MSYMKILRAFLITVMVLGFQNVLAQYSKSHYIPPITTTGNVAVGGNWPGSPDNTTIFPQTMAVDYVRVFQ